MRRIIVWVGVGAWLAGCSSQPEIWSNEASGADAEPDGEQDPEPDAEPEPEPPDADDDSSGFVPGTDTLEVEPCDPWSRDCPEGEKCVPYATAGSLWDSNKCVPVPDDPVSVGGKCHVGEDHVSSGIDDCEAGAYCWDIMDAGVGTCVELCWGDFSEPTCSEDTVCSRDKQGIISICFPRCVPVEDECPPGCGCYSGWDGVDEFSCRRDWSQTEGQAGDSCTGDQQCDPGLGCVDAELVDGCDGDLGCCTPYCDVHAIDPCPDLGSSCIAYFDEGQAPSGYESLGLCLTGG